MPKGNNISLERKEKMSNKFSPLKWGQMVLPLVAVTALLAAVSVKADIVLEDPWGTRDVTFNTDDTGGWVVGNSYTVSETFTLKDPNWFFTSFTLNPKNVTMMVQSVINNASPSSPAVDLTGPFTGTATWSGKVMIRSGDRIIGGNTANTPNNVQTIGEITYDKASLAAGANEFATSPEYQVDFTDLFGLGISLNADILAGAKVITFDFVLSDISFENNEIRDLNNAGVGNIWEGSINGLVSMTYDTTVSSVPEPASVLLFGLGLAGAALVTSRKRGAKK